MYSIRVGAWGLHVLHVLHSGWGWGVEAACAAFGLGLGVGAWRLHVLHSGWGRVGTSKRNGSCIYGIRVYVDVDAAFSE